MTPVSFPPAALPFAAAQQPSLSSFVGREHELAQVRTHLAQARLLTLTGTGGSGKTRLASALVELCAADYQDGVVWVELAPLSEPGLIASFILAAVGAEQGTRPSLTALIAVLRDRHLLLVLDNCEHLVDAVAKLAELLLRSCARLTVLATSREALGVAGERAWLVPGLALPQPGATFEEVSRSEAARLFTERAQAAVATFTLTEGNAQAVARICRRLDGLPLAIELAAARVRSLPPGQLANRLDDVFRTLASGPRTAIERHRTLREAIEWSYRLLGDKERLLLQRLSTFAGDVALDQIEVVCADAALEPADILDTLGALVDKSLVMVREAEGTARYQLLETIRQFARGKLEEAGTFHVICHRHARTYMTLVHDAASHFITRDRPLWVGRVQRELDNVRMALMCTASHHHDEHVRLVGELGWFWYSSGFWSEGRRWAEGAIALPPEKSAARDRAAALLAGGIIAALQSDPEAALPWLRECAQLSATLGDHRTEAYARAYLGIAYIAEQGSDEARRPLEQAAEWFRQTNDLYGLRLAHVVLATFFMVKRDLAAAADHSQRGAAIARDFGLDRELGIALHVHATVLLTQGDLANARQFAAESLLALKRDPSIFWIARGLDMLGIILCRMDETQRGVTLLAAGHAARESVGASPFAHDRERLAPVLAAARQELGDAGFDRLWNGARARSVTALLEEISAEPVSAGPSPQSGPLGDAPATAASLSLRSGRRDPVLEVRALGPLEILRDGAPLDEGAWRSARPRELLLHLLGNPQGRTRDQIGLVFWPEASAAQVRNNFHVALHQLRKALGRADLIVFEGDRYRVAWELGVRFDARDFEERLRPMVRALRATPPGRDASETVSTIEAALALYRGDLLEDQGAADWHLEWRAALRRSYSDALIALGEYFMRAERYAEAVHAYRRVTESDGLHEEAHRRLMLALARSGDRTEAMRLYERLSETLRRDMDAQPEAQTRHLMDRLRRGEAI